MVASEPSSAGHKLGQLLGDWYEEHFVAPLLPQVATELKLYLDCRFSLRKARPGEKILWQDADGNKVDYDFVLELAGSSDSIGVPVAFFECFWRRGSRHSKEKARDDSGKLTPMRETYPTARFLGIVAAGDFTEPARALVKSRGIDLLYVPKSRLLEAFRKHGMTVDYNDKSSEAEKARIAAEFESRFTPDAKRVIASTLRSEIGEAALRAYLDRVRSALSALPQEIVLSALRKSDEVRFDDIETASAFLKDPKFYYQLDDEHAFQYHVVYSDGSDFDRTVGSVEELRTLHSDIERLASHMSAILEQEE